MGMRRKANDAAVVFLTCQALGSDCTKIALAVAMVLGMVAVGCSAQDPPSKSFETITRSLDACTNPANAIVAENCQTVGVVSRTVWDLPGSTIGMTENDNLFGFTTSFSYLPGQTVNFKIKTPSSNYTVFIYRLGYYGGAGARQVDWVSRSGGAQVQAPCSNFSSNTPTPNYNVVDCSNWAISVSWSIPGTAVTGVYLAKVISDDGYGATHIPFVVKEPAGSFSDILFQTSDTTWQAYNMFTDSSVSGSFYSDPGARAVSYNRPFQTRTSGWPEYWLLDNEYPMIRWLEQNGYSVAYAGGLDVDQSSAIVSGRKVFLSVGHDEYWSGNQRSNVDAALTSGTRLAFLSGNQAFWKTRWAADNAGNANRVLISYKYDGKNDPECSALTWTGLWRDDRYNAGFQGCTRPASQNARSEAFLAGNTFAGVNERRPLEVPSTASRLRIWRGTSIASLSSGSALLGDDVVGVESDVRPNSTLTGPPGALSISLSASTGVQDSYYEDAETVQATWMHEATLFRAASGALVFGAGTINWPHGLDRARDTGDATSPTAVSHDLQQVTANVFSDLGVSPSTPVSTLVISGPSTDSVGPTVQIGVGNAESGVVMGSASDAGGAVAAIEGSSDGVTWSRADGFGPATNSWVWRNGGSLGGKTIRIRAVDDSANVGSAATQSFATPSGRLLMALGASGGGISSYPMDSTHSVGWTTIVPANINGDSVTDYLLYNAISGRLVMGIGTQSGPVGISSYPLDITGSAGWTTIVPVNMNGDSTTDYLFYNAVSGRLLIAIGAPGGGISSYPMDSTHSVGWTTIVPANINGDSVTDYLLYNAVSGRLVMGIGTQSGPVGISSYPLDTTGSLGWTTIVPVNMNGDSTTDYLFYNAVSGRLLIAIGAPGGGISSYPMDSTHSVGWTTIVPANINGDSVTDYLLYNAVSGRLVMGIGTQSGPVGISSYPLDITGSVGWTTIAPVSINGDSVTDYLFYQ
jgi:N,N-dimethylformamidase beta subunit-like, C-terminal